MSFLHTFSSLMVIVNSGFQIIAVFNFDTLRCVNKQNAAGKISSSYGLRWPHSLLHFRPSMIFIRKVNAAFGSVMLFE